MKLWGPLFFFVLASFCISVAKVGATENLVRVANLIKNEQSSLGYLPLVSEIFPSLTVADAYEIQRIVIADSVKKKGIGGYKASFTGSAGRDRFGLKGPVSGVLFSGCARRDGAILSLKNYPGLMLELEIGFRLKTAIVESVKTFKELMPHIGSALPVIELPQVKFDNLNNVSGVDLVATNMASACWVEGRTLSVRGFENYDKMEVGLFLNGELIDSGVGANVGGQAQALFWLIKHLQLLDRRL